MNGLLCLPRPCLRGAISASCLSVCLLTPRFQMRNFFDGKGSGVEDDIPPLVAMCFPLNEKCRNIGKSRAVNEENEGYVVLSAKRPKSIK